MKLEMEVGVVYKNGNNGGGVGLWLQHRNGGSAACHLLCTPVKVVLAFGFNTEMGGVQHAICYALL